jgi:DNA-directed RNA polymerase subunit RPC12/RpoP
MMVRVVKTEPHPSVVKEVVCSYCGATLEYVPADRKQKQVSDYIGDKETVNYIVCPPCGHEVEVK